VSSVTASKGAIAMEKLDPAQKRKRKATNGVWGRKGWCNRHWPQGTRWAIRSC
jgi:hypothetical protein